MFTVCFTVPERERAVNSWSGMIPRKVRRRAGASVIEALRDKHRGESSFIGHRPRLSPDLGQRNRSPNREMPLRIGMGQGQRSY
jgi:hypothetical protein